MHGTHSHTGSADAIETTPAPDERTAAITRLGATRDPAGIENLADEWTKAGAERWIGSVRGDLIEALVLCLSGDSIRQDAAAEDTCNGGEAVRTNREREVAPWSTE